MFDIDLNDDFQQVYHVDILAENGEHVRPDIARLVDNKSKHLSASDLRIEVLHCLSSDYLCSADALLNDTVLPFVEQHDIIISSDVRVYNFVPIGYLCRHAVELKLKEFLYKKGHVLTNSHDVKYLFFEFDWSVFNVEHWYLQICEFINDVSDIDSDGFHLRYGFNTQGNFYSLDSYVFNPFAFVFNTEYLFDVFELYGDRFKLK